MFPAIYAVSCGVSSHCTQGWNSFFLWQLCGTVELCVPVLALWATPLVGYLITVGGGTYATSGAVAAVYTQGMKLFFWGGGGGAMKV